MLLEDSPATYGRLSRAEVRENAGAAIERALALDPQLAEAHASKGLLLLNDNQVNGAGQWLSSAKELNPNYAMAHMWMGLVENQMGRFDLAEVSFRNTVELDPMSVVARNNLAYALHAKGKTEALAEQVDTIASLAPGTPLVLTGYAYRRYVRGDLLDAVENLERSIKLNPVYRLTRDMYGRLWLDLGDYERADQFLSDNPGWGLMAQGQFERLAQAAERLVDGNPSDPDRYANLAIAHLFAGNLEQARVAFENVDAHSTSRHDALFSGSGALFGGRLAALDRAAMYSSLGDRQSSRDLVAECRSFLAGIRGQGINIPNIYYLEAAAAAILEEPDKVVEFLERAIAVGFRSGWLLEVDPKLATVRDDPRFQKLLDNLKAINAETRAKLEAESGT